MSADLHRFVEAQDAGGTYDQALSELRSGRKRSHWMWFVFPQIAGLGSSPMARRYAIADRAEAAAYLDHEILGPRLREATQAVLDADAASATALLGDVDALKLRSSLTLFAQVADDDLYERALARWYDGEPDEATLHRL